MNRKGVELAMTAVIIGALGLIVFAIFAGLPFLVDKGIRTPMVCGTPSEGYICRSVCADGESRAWSKILDGCDKKQEGYVCCQARSEEAKANLKAGQYSGGIPMSIPTAGNNGNTPVSALSPPIIAITRGTSTQFSSGQTVQITTSGTQGDRAQEFQLVIRAPVSENCGGGNQVDVNRVSSSDGKDKAPVVQNCLTWKSEVLLESADFQDFSDYCDGNLCGSPRQKTTETSQGKSTPVQKTFKFPQVATFTATGALTTPLTIVPTDDFLGRKMRLVVRTYPGETWGEHSLLSSQYYLWFEFVPSVRYAGLTQAWAKSKTIGIECVAPSVCDDFFIRIQGDGIYDGTDETGKLGAVTTPEGEEETARACSQYPTSEEMNSALRMEGLRKAYCLTNGATVGDGGCFPDLDTCRQQLDIVRDSDFTSQTGVVIQAMNRASATNFGTEDPALNALLQQWSAAQSKAALWSCQPNAVSPNNVIATMNFDDGTPNANTPALQTARGYLFRSDTFDQATQKGAVTLDQAFMSGAYLCVYGRDKTTGQVYSAGQGRKIFIDTLPPQPSIVFKPWTLQIRLSCQDDGSGCKTTYGTKYISEVTSFLPALFAGDESATKYCPPATNAGAYSPESRNEFFYDGESLRVLCVRAEDQAGNTAVTMVKVYNSYDLLAKAIALYQQETK